MKTKMKNNKLGNHVGLLVDVYGRAHLVPFAPGAGLRKMYQLLHCRLVEAVRLPEPLAGLSIWLDEEGKFKNNARPNIPASLLFRALPGGDWLADRVLFLRDDPETGGAMSLTADDVRRVVSALTFAMTVLRDKIKIEKTEPRCEFYAF